MSSDTPTTPPPAFAPDSEARELRAALANVGDLLVETNALLRSLLADGGRMARAEDRISDLARRMSEHEDSHAEA
jgi:hypothetical protein